MKTFIFSLLLFIATSTNLPTSAIESFRPQVNVRIVDSCRQIYDINDDVCGYIYLSDSTNYPVMYTPYNQNYYINHDLNKKESKEGLPFLNRNSVFGEQGISLMYGHHLKSGRGFTVLKEFLKDKYINTHNTIRVDTLYENQTYQVVAVVLTSLNEEFNYYDYVGLLDNSEFNDWKSGFEKYVKWGSLSELVYTDTILELSTCYYHKSDGRLVVVLKCIDSY